MSGAIAQSRNSGEQGHQGLGKVTETVGHKQALLAKEILPTHKPYTQTGQLQCGNYISPGQKQHPPLVLNLLKYLVFFPS